MTFKYLNKLTTATIIAFTLSGCASTPLDQDRSEQLFFGGPILTMEGMTPTYAEALLVKDGKILTDPGIPDEFLKLISFVRSMQTSGNENGNILSFNTSSPKTLDQLTQKETIWNRSGDVTDDDTSTLGASRQDIQGLTADGLCKCHPNGNVGIGLDRHSDFLKDRDIPGVLHPKSISASSVLKMYVPHCSPLYRRSGRCGASP